MELTSNAYVIVPRGWQRLIERDSVIYVSPNQSGLRSRDEVVRYLNSPMTCKCGLKCPFSFDDHFNFDPKVLSLPDSRPFAGYSDCSLIPSLYIDNRHNKNKLAAAATASRRGGIAPGKTRPQVKVKSKPAPVGGTAHPVPTSTVAVPSSSTVAVPSSSTVAVPLPGFNVTPQLKQMSIPLSAISTVKGTTDNSQRHPQMILTAPNGKGGEVSYPVLDFQSLMKQLNTLMKSGTISPSTYTTLLSSCKLPGSKSPTPPVTTSELSSSRTVLFKSSDNTDVKKNHDKATVNPCNASPLKITATINPAASGIPVVTGASTPHVTSSITTPIVTPTTQCSVPDHPRPMMTHKPTNPLPTCNSPPSQPLEPVVSSIHEPPVERSRSISDPITSTHGVPHIPNQSVSSPPHPSSSAIPATIITPPPTSAHSSTVTTPTNHSPQTTIATPINPVMPLTSSDEVLSMTSSTTSLPPSDNAAMVKESDPLPTVASPTSAEQDVEQDVDHTSSGNEALQQQLTTPDQSTHSINELITNSTPSSPCSMHGNENSSNNNTPVHEEESTDGVTKQLSVSESDHSNILTSTTDGSSTHSLDDSPVNGSSNSTNEVQPVEQLDQNGLKSSAKSETIKHPKKRTNFYTSKDGNHVYNLRKKRKMPYFPSEVKRYKESPKVELPGETSPREGLSPMEGSVPMKGSSPIDGSSLTNGSSPREKSPVEGSTPCREGLSRESSPSEGSLGEGSSNMLLDGDLEAVEDQDGLVGYTLGDPLPPLSGPDEVCNGSSLKLISTAYDTDSVSTVSVVDHEYIPDCLSLEWSPSSPTVSDSVVSDTIMCSGTEGESKHVSKIGQPVRKQPNSAMVFSNSDLLRLQRSINDEPFVISIPYNLLPNCHVLTCYSSKTFQVGDIVWAKATGLRGWPAKVISNKSWKKAKLAVPPKDHVWVSWYQFQSVSLVEEESLKPLQVAFDVYKARLPRMNKFKKAIKEAFIDLFNKQKKQL